MKQIPLTQGFLALVDDADFEAVSAFKWHAHKRGKYAARNVRKPDGSRTQQLLHMFLLPGVSRIDHRDGDGLNNQRQNLRAASPRQNQQGFRRKASGTSSKYRGVSWHPRASKFVVHIKYDGKDRNLGLFIDEVAAAKAYDAAAREHFGEFATPNFP